MNISEKKIQKQNKLFSEIKSFFKNKSYDELYLLYKYYKKIKNLDEDRYLKNIYIKYSINYKNSNLLILEILKIIKKIVDEKTVKDDLDFNNYPEYNDANFINKINNKLEFNSLVIDNLDSIDCNTTLDDYFELAPYQIFLKNFYSLESPYKSLLIYHGTGVGKTCSGISVAENFTESNKKIIILASPNIINNWKNTILNTDKNSNQCTDNKYIDLFNNDKKNKNISISKIKKNIINKNYEFYGYLEFVNMIIKHIKEYITPDMKDNIDIYEQKAIREFLDDKLLIIDEIHNIRTEKEKSSRIIINTLYKIVRYSNNMKLLILSATPMYNSSIEIIWLLNLLLLNDNRPEITEKEIFKDDKLTSEGIELLNNKCKGYISFIRGNNPKTFPYRLYPTINKNTKQNILKLKQIPLKDPFNNKILDKNKIEYLKNKLYGCKFTGHQKNIYENFIKQNPNNKRIYDNQLHQISIFTYPLLTKNIKDTYGINGLKRCFDENNGIYSYKKELVKNKDIGYFFQIDKLKEFSCKFHLLLETIKSTKGLIFIYSRYISSSIIPLQLALEENGYGRYNGRDILNKTGRKIEKISYDGYTEKECKKFNKSFKQAKYIVLSGEEDSKNNILELEKLNNTNNKYGEDIKIIIGSEVTKEGIDMKRIREIHIIEPWYHLNRIEQIIGRGIRYCSHKDLRKDEKNVTIYKYCSFNESSIESSDIYMYRRAEIKSRDILQIENILQKNAIDCSIFRNLNEIDETKLINETIVTSQQNSKENGLHKYQVIDNYNPYKKQYFNLLCSTYCNYKCKIKNIEKTKDIDTLNKKHIDNIFKIVYKYIAGLYKIRLVYDINTILDSLKLYINIDKSVLYLCLDKIINEKIMLQTENNVNGYLIYKNKNYIFQPDNLEENISFFDRDKKYENTKNYIGFRIDKKTKETKEKQKTLKKDKKDDKEINITITEKNVRKKIKKLNMIFNLRDKDTDEIIFNYSWLSDDIKFQYSLDRLSPNYKIHLLYYISKGIDFTDIYDVNSYFTPNFIYKIDKKYVLNNDKYLKNPIGFYLNNNNEIKYYFIRGTKIKEVLITDKILIEETINSDIYIEYIMDIFEYNAYGYGFFDKNNNLYLKIKSPNKSSSNRGMRDKLGCRICNSNDFKISDIKNYIQNIRNNKNEYDKLNKINLCIYIELLLRYKSILDDRKYYINIDNFLLSDIVLNNI
jgi:superfamily II DNA or RNA helicase